MGLDDFEKKRNDAAENWRDNHFSPNPAVHFKAGADWAKEELFKQTPELLKFGEMRQEIERLKEVIAGLPKIPMESHEKSAHKAAIKWRELANKMVDGFRDIRKYSLGSKADICDEMLAEFEAAKKEME